MLTYVVTESEKDWRDHVLDLAKLLVEGLDKQAIRCVARHVGCDDNTLASIKLLGRCLEAKGVESSLREAITDPLETLWGLRSGVAAHSGGGLPEGDLKLHYRHLLERCD